MLPATSILLQTESSTAKYWSKYRATSLGDGSAQALINELRFSLMDWFHTWNMLSGEEEDEKKKPGGEDAVRR